MDNIWDRKSFEVGGHWPLWQGWKKRMTTQNRQKSNAKRQLICFSFEVNRHKLKNGPWTIEPCNIYHRQSSVTTSVHNLFTFMVSRCRGRCEHVNTQNGNCYGIKTGQDNFILMSKSLHLIHPYIRFQRFVRRIHN